MGSLSLGDHSKLRNDSGSIDDLESVTHEEACEIDATFEIQTQRVDNAGFTAVVERTCGFSDMMRLHAGVSESVGQILPQFSDEQFYQKQWEGSASGRNRSNMVENS